MLEHLIFLYGYPAIFVGAALEGEFVPVLAGLAAYEGYLNLAAVISVGFLGSIFADQLYYLLGQSRGQAFLNNRPRLQKRIGKVLYWIDKHMVIPLVLFRFVYGVRSITPIVLGATGTRYLKFLFYDIIGAAFWIVALTMAGYLFGGTAELIITDIRRHELPLVIIVGVIFVAVWLWVYIKRRRRAKIKSSTEEQPE